jgi:hypothetical protein
MGELCNFVCYPQAQDSSEEKRIFRDILPRTDKKKGKYIFLGQFRTKGQLNRNMNRNSQLNKLFLRNINNQILSYTIVKGAVLKECSLNLGEQIGKKNLVLIVKKGIY